MKGIYKMNLIQETKFLMKKYHITANKNYGQNFLIDEKIVEAITESANISKDDVIIEIGPGLGTLTARLLEKAGKVICIELDPKMLDILNDRFTFYSNFELINDDVLKVDLKAILMENLKRYKSAKVVEAIQGRKHFFPYDQTAAHRRKGTHSLHSHAVFLGHI